MPTLDRCPNPAEVDALVASHPVTCPVGRVSPILRYALGGTMVITGGLWFLRFHYGVIVAVLSRRPSDPETILAWAYDDESGGYVPIHPNGTVEFAQSLHPRTGQAVD